MTTCWRPQAGAPVLAALALAISFSMIGCRDAGFKRTYMALDAQGNRKRTTFYTDTASIYCDGELVSGTNDVTVQSLIRIRTIYDPSIDRNIPASGFSGLAEIAPGKGDTQVSFVLDKTEGQSAGADASKIPYYPGEFSCELSINGELESVLDYDVRFPDCPQYPAENGIVCAGWVKTGSRCPSSLSGRDCVCAPSGKWTCDF